MMGLQKGITAQKKEDENEDDITWVRDITDQNINSLIMMHHERYMCTLFRIDIQGKNKQTNKYNS